MTAAPRDTPGVASEGGPQATVPTEGVLVRDAVSYGVYPIPGCALVVVDSPPEEAGVVPVGMAYLARLTAESCQVQLPPTIATRDVRVFSGQASGGVLSWIRVPTASASSWLVEALPGFWLNRHRLPRELAEAIERGAAIPINNSTKLGEQRERLYHHANSLKCKLWTLQYHRGNLRSALRDCAEKPHEKNLHLVKANAELTAHDNECYALLDELAALLSILSSISRGVETPTSFHDLHKARAKQHEPLKAALQDTAWYESFRMRRANSTHAFKAFSSLNRETSEVLLWQHPDRRIFTVPDLALNGRNATDVVDELATSFDDLVARLSIHMLSLFHPFDVVRMHMKSHREGPVGQPTVWTRRIFFSPDLEWVGHALLDPDGGMELWTGANGIEMGPPSKAT